MIDCDKIKKETKDLMFKLMKNSSTDHKQRYILLCEDKGKNIISSDICIGSLCSTPIGEREKITCPESTKEIGDFRTQIVRELGPGDIAQVAVNTLQSFCVGYVPTNTIRCFDIKNKELLRLGRNTQDLVKKRKIQEIHNIVSKMHDILKHRGYGNNWPGILDTKCVLTRRRDDLV